MKKTTPTNQENQIIIYKSADGKSQVSLYAQDGNIWLSQKQIAELFDTSLPNINMHISAILKEGELQENSVIKYFLTTALDGKNYNVAFYSLEMINDYKILDHKGKISSPEMEEKVSEIYTEFDSRRKAFEAKIADEEDLKELENLVKNKRNKAGGKNGK